LQRGKIDLSHYGSFEEYSTPLLRWRKPLIGIPLVIVASYGMQFYNDVHLWFDPEFETIPPPGFMPLITLGLIIAVVLVTFLTRYGRVITFQEGIYVDPGRRLTRDPARIQAFLPWDEITQIIRTPHSAMRMSIVGENPLDEVILPENLRKQFDEIQDQVLHMRTGRKVEVVKLDDDLNFPIAEYGSVLQDLYSVAPITVMGIPFFKAFIRDIGLMFSVNSLDMPVNAGQAVFLPILSGLAAFLIIGFIFYLYFSGRFKNRMIVYRRGLLRIAMGSGSFTRWEELTSIEKLRPGVYRIHPSDDTIKAQELNVGKTHDMEFERILRRLGQLAV